MKYIVRTSSLLLLVAFGCSANLGAEQAQLQWEDQRPSSYSYRYVAWGVMFALPPSDGLGSHDYRVTVRDGVVVDVQRLSDDPGPSLLPEDFLTVDGLFEAIGAAGASGDNEVQAVFDPVLGFPTKVDISWIEESEHVEISELEILTE